MTTLFHETGHGLQHMLTTVPHKPAAGIEGVEWDAVELPSQFLEEFCYDEATIYGYGSGASTPMPACPPQRQPIISLSRRAVPRA